MSSARVRHERASSRRRTSASARLEVDLAHHHQHFVVAAARFDGAFVRRQRIASRPPFGITLQAPHFFEVGVVVQNLVARRDASVEIAFGEAMHGVRVRQLPRRQLLPQPVRFLKGDARLIEAAPHRLQLILGADAAQVHAARRGVRRDRSRDRGGPARSRRRRDRGRDRSTSPCRRARASTRRGGTTRRRDRSAPTRSPADSFRMRSSRAISASSFGKCRVRSPRTRYSCVSHAAISCATSSAGRRSSSGAVLVSCGSTGAFCTRWRT